MRASDKAIVLQAVRHGDRQSIVKLYTAHHGLVTVIASAGRSSAAKIRAACLLPLTLLDVNFSLRQNHEIHRLSEASCYYVHDNIAGNLAKLSIAQFMNEVLVKSLKEQQANPQLFSFIESCLNYLNDAERDYYNLHLFFLRDLSKHLGFEPQNNYSPGAAPFFDCREGGFTAMGFPFPLGLSLEDSVLFSRFLGSNPLREEVARDQRQWLLEIWLAYYRLHLPGFGELRSLEVLREVGQ